jgi:hypothetical protein
VKTVSGTEERRSADRTTAEKEHREGNFTWMERIYRMGKGIEFHLLRGGKGCFLAG